MQKGNHFSSKVVLDAEEEDKFENDEEGNMIIDDGDGKLASEEMVRLTKHLNLIKDLPPLYTGGSFALLKNDRHCLALRDSKICLFDMQTSKVLTVIAQENEEILCFAISPNQHFLALSNKNYMIRVFALPDEVTLETMPAQATLEQVKQFKTTGQMVLELAFDPSSKFLAAGTAESSIKVYDVAKGFQTHNFTGGHRGIITNLHFFPESDTLLLISSAEDCQIKVWDLVMRAKTAHLKGHTALVTSITVSQDRTTLISCAKDGKVAFWNAKDGFKQLSIFKYSKSETELNAVLQVVVQDQPYLVVGGASGALSVFDINQSKTCFTQKDGFTAHEITKVIPFHKNSGKVLVLNADQQMSIYDLKQSSKKGSVGVSLVQSSLNCLYLDEIIDVRLLETEEGAEDTNKVAAQPRQALICSNNELLKVVDLQTGQIIQSGKGSHSEIILCIDSWKRSLFLSGSKDNTVRLWSFKDQKALSCVAVFTGHNENVTSVCFAPKKANFFVSASQDNTIKIWDLQSLKESGLAEEQEVNSASMTVMGHQKYINVVRVSPNDKLIASCSQDKTVKIWNSSDLVLTQTLNGHKKGVWDCAFSPVDKLLVSASGDKTVKVWNITNGSCISTLSGHLTSLVKVCWLNAGLQLASASADGIVKLWNLKKQACVNTIQMHDSQIWALHASHDDRYLITGGGDSSLKLWQDCTLEKEQEDKENALQRLQDEQKLSSLIREEDFIEAAMMAFRLNKLRDFYLVINKIIQNKTAKVDPVDSVLQDRLRFKSFIECNITTGGVAQKQAVSNNSMLTKIVSQLLQQDNKNRLVEILRNLNSKHQYAHIAQAILGEMLPRIKIEEFLESDEYKGGAGQSELKEALKVIGFYSAKHGERAERGLKKAYYPEYVLSQMTLDEELKTIHKTQVTAEPALFVENKTKVQSAKQINSQLKKNKKLKSAAAVFGSDNLFDEKSHHPEDLESLSTQKKRIKK